MSLVAKAGYQALRVYWFLTRPVTLGVKVFLVDSEGRLLLVKHTYQPGWHIPGGKVDRGESLAEAAARELWEEVGLRANIQPHELKGIFRNPRDFKHDHVAMFQVTQWEPGPLKIRRGEIADAQFFRLRELPSDATPATVRRVQEYLGDSACDFAW